MSLFNTGLLVKDSEIPGRGVNVTAGFNSLTGFALSNVGPRVAVVQLVQTDAGTVALDDRPLSASDIRLYGHWEIMPGEYVFSSGYDYPYSVVEFGGLNNYGLLLFAKDKAAVAYCFRGETF